MGSDPTPETPALTGAAAREARKKRAEEKAAQEAAAAKQARKERQEAAKRKEEEAEAARLKKIADARKKRTTGVDPVQDVGEEEAPDPAEEESRRQRLAEKIAARRAAMEKDKVEEASSESEDEASEEKASEPSEPAKKEEPSKITEEKAEGGKNKSSGSSTSSAAPKKSFSGARVKKLVKEKKVKEKKLKKKKKKKKKSSSSSWSPPSPAAMAVARQLAMKEVGCFAWENEKKEQAQPVILAGVGATPEELETWLASHCGHIDFDTKERFRQLSPVLQKLCIDRGIVSNSRCPNSVLMARARDAENGLLGTPGEAEKPCHPKIEEMITKYKIDPNCGVRLRQLPMDIQKYCLSIFKPDDLASATNVSGMIMAKLNEIKLPETKARIAFR
jgi:hypothetical protein